MTRGRTPRPSSGAGGGRPPIRAHYLRAVARPILPARSRAAAPAAAHAEKGCGVTEADPAYSEQNPMPVAVVSDYI